MITVDAPATSARLRPPMVVDFLAQALAQLAESATEGSLASVTLPAPVVAIDRMLADGHDDYILWHPPDGEAMCGLGSAAEVTATGCDRFAAVTERATALAGRLTEAHHPEVIPTPLRWFGGFAFVAGGAAAPPWCGFGDARFTIPRWSYHRHLDRAYLRLTLAGTELTSGSRQITEELANLLARLARPEPAEPPAARMISRGDAAQPVASWETKVEEIRATIASGRAAKIVAARSCLLEFDRPVAGDGVLAHLAASYPDCYRFGFRHQGVWFLGATPERLIERRGDEIVTQALAGSIAVDDSSPMARRRAATLLRASRKNLGEQALVVRAIAETLAGLCSELAVPPAPVVRELRHLLHLETPIHGRLAQPTHLLELAERLHPTPAVGGTPTPLAVDWIGRNEERERGWYAGPIGWFDHRGDGELAVAIRSGSIWNRRALLYAGAGIVSDSEATAELAETEMKLRPMLAALGVPPAGGVAGAGR